MDASWPLRTSPLRFFDLETTGLRPDRGARITEAAVMDHRDLQLYWHCDHGSSIARMVPQLISVLTETVVVGHNLAFDFRFLTYEAERQKHPPFTLRYIDTLALARRLDLHNQLPDLALQTLAEHMMDPETIGAITFHTAQGDARATRAVLWSLAEQHALHSLSEAGLQRFSWTM